MDDEFRIIKEGILLIEHQEYDENNNIARYYQEKRVSLVSEEGCIILYYSDVKNKSFETAQFVSIMGCKLLVCDNLDFEIVLSPNFSIKFQSTTSEDKRKWIEDLEIHTIKVQVGDPIGPNNNNNNNSNSNSNDCGTTPQIHKLRLGGGVSLPELKINSDGNTHHRNFNLSAPAQVQEEESKSKTRPINNINVTPRVPQRRELTDEEKSIISKFPYLEVEIILDALEFCGGDKDEVVSLLSTQTRLSFQDLNMNSYSPLGKSVSKNSSDVNKGSNVSNSVSKGNDDQSLSSSFIRKNIERELEELERELEEYGSDDEDSIDGDLERELIENTSKDDPQLATFLAKYCTTSYTSSESNSRSSSFNSGNGSQTQFQKLRVKSHRLKQIEEYYNYNNQQENSSCSSSCSSISSSPLPPQPNNNNSNSSNNNSSNNSNNQVIIPPTPSVPDISNTLSSPSSLCSDDQEFDEKSLNVNNNHPNNQLQCNNNNCNIKNSNINNNNNKNKEKENNRVHLIIRKKSIISNVNSSFNGTHNSSLQWSYRAPSSLSINQLSEPIGLRSSHDRSNLSNSSNSSNNSLSSRMDLSNTPIFITPPSSPTITPPISPTLLASSSPSKSSQVWKPSLKAGMAWDLSISVMGFLKLKDHIEYRIHIITRHSEWIVYRRYNNFFLLHKMLRILGVFKNSYVKLPSKHLRGTSYQVAKSRQQSLQNYLTTLLSTFKGIFYNNSCVNVFLNSDVDSDVFQQFMIQQFDHVNNNNNNNNNNNTNTNNNNNNNQQLNKDSANKNEDNEQNQPISLSSSTPSPLSTNRVTLQTTSVSFIK